MESNAERKSSEHLPLRAHSLPRSNPNESLREVLSRPVFVSVVTFSMLSLITSVTYGYSYLAKDHVELYFGVATILYVAVAAVCVMAFLRAQLVAETHDKMFNRLLGGLLTALSIAVTCYFQSDLLPVHWMFPSALAGLFVIFAATAFGRGALLALVALGVVVLASMPITTPLEIARANMLPIIDAACSSLAQGAIPFRQFEGIARADFRYLPGLYYPYCAIQAFGVDLRVLNVIVLTTILVLGFIAMDGWRKPETITVGLCPLLFSSAAAQMLVNGHIWTFWLLVICLGLLVLRQRLFAAAVVAGVLAATRQQSAILLVPAFGFLCRAVAPAKLFQVAALAAIVALLGLLPALVQVDDFLGYFFLDISTISKLLHEHGNPSDQIALSGIIATAGLREMLVPLQVFLMIAFAVVFALRPPKTWEGAIFVLGAGFLFIVSFSTSLHRYFLMPGLLLMSVPLGTAICGRWTPFKAR